ncbi:hypothetical protein [Candidatus Accumulibacter sp. ACC003]|uniref:hypothetical protein n=1 Tax=Candidatus Accumulibacter sp. ACC003 TaxID=2823334 RepID=UPI0025B7D498|nr:hypothetical protein [Candidatus Accumulibacter sp. ACC003]
MINLLKKMLSPVLNWLLEPLVCRIDDRLRRHLDEKLARVDSALFPRLLPVVIKNELICLEFLPRDILGYCGHLHFIGYYAADVALQFPGATAFSPVDAEGAHPDIDIVDANSALVFLDEYHFQRFMETRWSSLSTVAGTLLIATRFEFLPEADCRLVLHSLGFIEVACAYRGTSGGKTEITAVSHAEATNCKPRYIKLGDSPSEAHTHGGWLVARRCPRKTERRVDHVD